MRSAARTVDSRWAITRDVRWDIASVRASWTADSLVESSALVASSSTTTDGSAMSSLAMVRRCLSPPERRYPRSPMTVSSPSGSDRTSSSSRARRRASHTSSSVTSGRAKVRLDRIVSWKRWPSWVTMPTVRRNDDEVTSRTSRPATRTAPESTS